MIHYFNVLENTNSTLKELAKNDAKPFLTVYTKNQTKGRGTYGNQWNSEPDKNLLFSTLINVNLMENQEHYLSLWVANSLQLAINKFLKNVLVKWPNDLVVRNKKLCGILIEPTKINHKKYYIIGVGININQTEFKNLPNATSIKKETGIDFCVDEILHDSLSCFKNEIHKLNNPKEILTEYNNHLYRKGIVSAFKKDNVVFNGMIKKVKENGNLEVLLENDELLNFKHKEIELLY